jgi:hypothetical protein
MPSNTPKSTFHQLILLLINRCPIFTVIRDVLPNYYALKMSTIFFMFWGASVKKVKIKTKGIKIIYKKFNKKVISLNCSSILILFSINKRNIDNSKLFKWFMQTIVKNKTIKFKENILMIILLLLVAAIEEICGVI